MLIDTARIRETLRMGGLIDALAGADRARIETPPRQHYHPSGGTFLTMPAWSPRYIGLKTVTVFPGNASAGLPTVLGQYLLLSAQTGEPLAMIDGTELTLWRTAAVAALASSRLAFAPPDEVLIVGTGALAPYMVDAFRSVHPAASLRVWGRDRARALAVAEASGAIVEPGPLDRAARTADIICCATSSHVPLIEGRWLGDRFVLVLMGSFSPEMREADADAILGAALYVDTGAALEDAGELASLVASGDLDARSVGSLRDLLAAGFQPPPRSVFKSVGHAENDLIAATHLVELISGGLTVSPPASPSGPNLRGLSRSSGAIGRAPRRRR